MLKILMGCVSTRPRRTASFPDGFLSDLSLPTEMASSSDDSRFFQVTSVSGRGKRIQGTLEINDNEIILHRPRHPDVRWPLHFLRRYGYEPGIFSFESGRRCESGPGVFTFRCERAEQLFCLVQQHVQDSASTQLSPAPPIIVQRTRLVPNESRSGSISPSPHSDDYLRPDSALISVRRASADSDSHTLVEIRPRSHSSRPCSLSLEQSDMSTSMVSCSPSLNDCVFQSPKEDSFSPPHAYINVQMPEEVPRPQIQRHCSETAAPIRFEDSARTSSDATIILDDLSIRGHKHSTSDITDDRSTSYVNFLESSRQMEEPLSPKLDYVTLTVGSRRANGFLAAHPSSSSLGRSLTPSFRRPTAPPTRPFLSPHIRPTYSLDENCPQSNYARIDCDKTRALKKSSRDSFSGPSMAYGTRRTRHDSAFS